jgi:hypothetical protein
LAQCQNSPLLPDSWRESKTLSTSKRNHQQGTETAFRPLSLFFTQLAKMALQAFPTKQEFLASELEPVERPECPICQEIMVEPVRLPCQGRHEFCKACITKWFEGQGNRTCPNCRQALCRPKHSRFRFCDGFILLVLDNSTMRNNRKSCHSHNNLITSQHPPSSSPQHAPSSSSPAPSRYQHHQD